LFSLVAPYSRFIEVVQTGIIRITDGVTATSAVVLPEGIFAIKGVGVVFAPGFKA
jgi:hypothetical protein